MSTLTLQPDAATGIDASTRESSADSNKGLTQYFYVRGLSGLRDIGLLKFDLAALVGTTINDATLYLYGLGGSSGSFYINRILAANSGWTEAGATWQYAVASSTRWAGDTGGDAGGDAGCSVSGTDFSSTAMGGGAFSGTLGAESSFALDLTEFVAMVAANYGMVIRDQDTGTTQIKQPASSDNATAGYRPKLVVNYTAGGAVVKHLHYARMRQ